jgi:diazepam-binding inhibitor (GABA receptor modulating acyl-CoA-binding protein)
MSKDKDKSKEKEVKEKEVKEKDYTDQFKECANEIKKRTDLKLDNETLLYLYGYYKQATEGDCTTEAPGFFDFTGKAKHEAWVKNKGISKQDSMRKYIKKVKSILEETK